MGLVRLLGLAGIVLPVTVVVAPSPAFAVVPGCGSNITVNTTLTGNMSCPGNGLNVVASNISLDLNGFTITGPGPDVRPSPTEIYSGVNVAGSGVVVKNGRIEAFTIGVTTRSRANNDEITGLTLHNNGQGYLTQSGAPGGLGPFSDDSWFHDNTIDSSTSSPIVIQGNRHRVESNRILANRFGVSIQGSGTLFRANVVDGNRSTGVNVGSNVLGDDNVVAGNSITNNTGNGVNIGGPSTSRVLQNNRIEGNRIASNGDPANTFGAVNVFSSSGAVVTGNQVIGIGRAIGIALNTGSANSVVSGNELTSNTDGLFVSSGATATTVSGNNASRNTHDGIRVASTSTTLMANVAFFNATFGIEAINGVVDGGGNRAAGNGVAQCSPSLACT
jgi:parallel beta-helix repeat protein